MARFSVGNSEKRYAVIIRIRNSNGAVYRNIHRIVIIFFIWSLFVELWSTFILLNLLIIPTFAAENSNPESNKFFLLQRG